MLNLVNKLVTLEFEKENFSKKVKFLEAKNNNIINKN